MRRTGLLRDEAAPLHLGPRSCALDSANDIIYQYGLGGSLKKPFTLIGEVFGQGSQNTGAQLGIRYTPVEKIDFDLIYGRNLTGEHANWITLGVNLRN